MEIARLHQFKCPVVKGLNPGPAFYRLFVCSTQSGISIYLCQRYIALIAHNARKHALMAFVNAHREFFQHQELVATDPGIERGLLALELYRWRVPKRNWARKSYQLGETPWP